MFFLIVCYIVIDFVFLIDGFVSVEWYGIGNFCWLVDFVCDVIFGFIVLWINIRVGIIVFGIKFYVFFGFNSYINNGVLFNRFNKGVYYLKLGSCIGRVLLMV